MKLKIDLSKEQKEADQKIVLEFIANKGNVRPVTLLTLGQPLEKAGKRIYGTVRAYIGLDDLIDQGLVCEGEDKMGLFYELTPRGKQKYDLIKNQRN